ncbi:hypothetical protein E2562_007010 [Oryza meyeriana var. granulata]|uniref:Uncharacterized protein n=1 Tax=Oryza meyeriana var. granulata TaxID=110450 RepID=A0A6G1E9L5_9ORYZ|nr:hypothetical protein E2562_007010 [Oryza meyeriana var. granulata]
MSSAAVTGSVAMPQPIWREASLCLTGERIRDDLGGDAAQRAASPLPLATAGAGHRKLSHGKDGSGGAFSFLFRAMEDDGGSGEREVAGQGLYRPAVLGASEGDDSLYDGPTVKGEAEGVDAAGSGEDGQI